MFLSVVAGYSRFFYLSIELEVGEAALRASRSEAKRNDEEKG